MRSIVVREFGAPEVMKVEDVAELTGRPGLEVDLDSCLPLTGSLADEVAQRLATLGRVGDDVETTLNIWADIENLEERMVPGQIDPIVLAHLRALTEGPA